MVTAIVKRDEPVSIARGLQIENMADLSAFGSMLAKSGYFKDAREAAQACVKVQAGLELGIPPVQAMTGIHIVEGKPTLSAALIATLVKRSGKYDYRIIKHDETECVIAFFQGKDEIGRSSFSSADADKAGVGSKQVWRSYRRNMLFARAMSNGARWHCPDVFGGSIYTPEEMGADVNGDGEPVVRVAHVVEEERSGPVARAPSSTPDVKVLQSAARAELDRLLVGNGLGEDDAKAARTNAVKRINDGKRPATVEDWASVVAKLREEPTPETLPDGDDSETNSTQGA